MGRVIILYRRSILSVLKDGGEVGNDMRYRHMDTQAVAALEPRKLA